ncbi:MAG: uracil-DNA glycosylase family protein [Armatimonadia bacterium]
MLPEGLTDDKVRIVMICESPPPDPAEGFYAPETGASAYRANTLQAFNEAGVPVRTMSEISALGVYITTAVKTPKTGNAVDKALIKQDAAALEEELAQFPNAQVYLLMGDVAIAALNEIARRRTGKRAIPAGSTYKLRSQEFTFEGKRLIPSYLQTGGSYQIEKYKREVVAEDIGTALSIAGAR